MGIRYRVSVVARHALGKCYQIGVGLYFNGTKTPDIAVGKAIQHAVNRMEQLNKLAQAGPGEYQQVEKLVASIQEGVGFNLNVDSLESTHGPVIVQVYPNLEWDTQMPLFQILKAAALK